MGSAPRRRRGPRRGKSRAGAGASWLPAPSRGLARRARPSLRLASRPTARATRLSTSWTTGHRTVFRGRKGLRRPRAPAPLPRDACCARASCTDAKGRAGAPVTLGRCLQEDSGLVQPFAVHVCTRRQAVPAILAVLRARACGCVVRAAWCTRRMSPRPCRCGYRR